MLFVLAGIFSRSGRDPSGDEHYRRLIADHLGFIEDRCYKAYGIGSSRRGAEDVPGSNRADSLLVEVLDHLSADGFRVLKEFRGRSSVKRYLEVVISNKVVDLYRRREGRSRAAEEARSMGPTGVRLYELVFVNGLPVEQAHGVLVKESGYSGGLDALEDMAGRIRSRQKPAHGETALDGALPMDGGGRGRLRVVRDDTGELTVPDTSTGPERVMDDRHKESAVAEALAGIAAMLGPQERLMVKMRYNGGMKVRDIAAALGLKEKGAYRIFERILSDCRRMLAEKGLGPDDLL